MRPRTSSPICTLDEWCRRAIGVPFLPHGRDYDGWDCWGLVVCAYRDVAGVAIPDYAYDSVDDHRGLITMFGDRAGGYWRQLSAPEPMAIAAIYRRGHVIHAGLVVTDRRIMHVERGIETCMESAANLRIEGHYVPADRSATPV